METSIASNKFQNERNRRFEESLAGESTAQNTLDAGDGHPQGRRAHALWAVKQFSDFELFLLGS